MNMGVEDQAKLQCRLIELTKTAYNLLDTGDNGRAVEYFERAAKMARERGNASTVVPCCLNAGACLVSQGKFQQGYGFLQFALKRLRSQRAERDLMSRSDFGSPTASCSSKTAGSIPEDIAVRMSADIHHYLGIFHQGMEDYQKALAHFQLSLKKYHSASSQAAESFTHSSQCYRQMRDVEMETTSLKRAEEVYHQLGDRFNEARICIDLTRVYLREGRSDDSKQMLSTAKLLCQHVENCVEKRKLYSELGLLHVTMGQFDLGMQSFEQALMLVQKGRRTSKSLQAEAPILQNVGAAYNEKAMFPEAIVYHKEAAVIHGKFGNYNSESKCLCNLASAQSQLDRLQEATVTFSKALVAAHHADNTELQLQAYEGLGSIQLQWARHGEAVCYFERALGLLDNIKEDSRIVRERIMEKLSAALKLLEQKECLASKMKLGVRQEDEDKEGISNVHIKRETSSEFATATLFPSSGKIPPCGSLPNNRIKNNRGKSPLIRRTGGRLPPLHTSGKESPPLPLPKLDRCHSKRGKEKLQQHPTNRDTESNSSAELQTYMDIYKSSPDDDIDFFKTSLERPSPSGIPDGTQSPIKEGSLAIGAQAREKFKVRRTVEEGNKRWKGKGEKGRRRQRIRNEIVSISALPQGKSTSSEEQEDRGNNRAQAKTNSQQSKMCIIL